MTVKRKTAKRSIKVPRGTISRISYTPPKLPDKPPITIGSTSYGLSKRGQHITTRFFIRSWNGYRWVKNRWWVVDLEGERSYAAGTAKEGYGSKKEATNKAAEYRDKYGAWSLVPF